MGADELRAQLQQVRRRVERSLAALGDVARAVRAARRVDPQLQRRQHPGRVGRQSDIHDCHACWDGSSCRGAADAAPGARALLVEVGRAADAAHRASAARWTAGARCSSMCRRQQQQQRNHQPGGEPPRRRLPVLPPVRPRPPTRPCPHRSHRDRSKSYGFVHILSCQPRDWAA